MDIKGKQGRMEVVGHQPEGGGGSDKVVTDGQCFSPK